MCLLRFTANSKGVKVLFRTGAAFVSARLGIDPIPPMTSAQLSLDSNMGGLIIAGSYVPKTTAQLQTLIERSGSYLTTVVIDVERLLKGDEVLASALETTEEELRKGQDVLVMTSRKLVTGSDEGESLDIGSAVARTLVQFLQQLAVRPRYIIAKVSFVILPAHSPVLVTNMLFHVGRHHRVRRGNKGTEIPTSVDRGPSCRWRTFVEM